MAIQDRLDVDTEGYEPISPPVSNQQLDQPLLPVRDSKLRFSAPNIPGAFPSSDTLIGYHLGGQVPQYRIPVPPQQSGALLVTTSGTAITGSSTSTTTNNPPTAQTASVVTSVLSPGGQFTGVVTMAKAFVVLSIAVGVPARVRLYGSAMAQTTDLSRPITNGPGFGTEQNVIGDVYLDTAPVVWRAVDMVGSNADGPQTSAAYITVDNIGNSTQAISVSIVYVPIQS